MTTAAIFRAAVRGIPNHHLTKALHSMTPGIIWTGSPKVRIAEAYEDANNPARQRYSYYQLRKLDLDKLVRRARARMAGDRDWFRA